MRILIPVAAQLDRRLAKKKKKDSSVGWWRGKRSAEFRVSRSPRGPDADDCSLRLVDASALLTLPEHNCDEQFTSPDTVVSMCLCR